MSRKVLVVDDEKLIVKGIRFSLEQDGMEVDCAYDGEEAVEKAKDKKYDIILLDLMLPKMDGLEVCQQIREFSNVPIVMLSQKELMDRAVNIGADVPYCVMRGTALAEGIGEKLTRITQVPDCFVLIGKPGINVSTKAAYESLQLDKISSHPDIDGMIGDIERGDLLAMTQKMGNVFEPGIIEKYPVIGEIKALMESHGALKAMMSGSGPTVFGIFDDREKMEAAAEVLRESRLAKTVFATEVMKAGGNTNDK